MRRATPLLILVGAAILSFVQIKWTFMLQEDRSGPDLHFAGQAHRPFVYRVATTWVLQAMVTLTPESVHQALEGPLGPLVRLALPSESSRFCRLSYYPLIGLLLTLCLAAYVRINCRLFEALFPEQGDRSGAVAFWHLAIVYHFVRDGYGRLYDFPHLLTMSLLLWIMFQGRHGLFLAVFSFSCLVKETTVLATVAWASVFRDRIPRWSWLIGTLAQLGIFVLVYGSLRHVFRDNAGGPVEVHYPDHFTYWADLTPAALLWIVPYSWLILNGWRDLPEFTKRCALMLLPHYALYVWGAQPGEMRNFYEVLPLLSLMSVRNLLWLQDRLAAAWTAAPARA